MCTQKWKGKSKQVHLSRHENVCIKIKEEDILKTFSKQRPYGALHE